MLASIPKEMENSSDEPSTSTAVSSGREPAASSPPDGPVGINSIGSFYMFYDVGKKLASGSHGTAFEGIRRTDNQPVIIKFVKKHRFDFHIGQSEPLCREAAIMRIMKHSDHVMKLYDWFEVVHHNILTMEHPGTNMTLLDFVKENGGRLSEAEAKDIMQKLIAALQHCSEQGVYYENISLRKVLIDKDTMQIKLTGFYRALTISERQAERTIHTLKVANEGLYRVLKGMVGAKCLWFAWKNTHLSKECQDLLRKLHDRESDITLQNIVDHDWLNNTPDTDALESDVREGRPGAPVVEYAEPSTSAAGSAQVCPQTPRQEPTPAAGTPETKRHTPRQKPTLRRPVSVKTTDLTLMFPNDLIRQKEYFRSLYVVGRKLNNNDLVRTGVRRSDNQKVVIKFVLRSRGQEEFKKPVRDGESMMELQKFPTCLEIIRILDRFITEQSCILVTEYLPLYMTFKKYVEMNRGLLRESTVNWIINQIILIMHHSTKRGFFYDVDKKWILINPMTLNIKLTDFDVVYFTRDKEDQALMRKVLFSRKTMQYLISHISHPFRGRGYISRECRNFKRDVLQRKTWRCKNRTCYNLRNILDHPWLMPEFD